MPWVQLKHGETGVPCGPPHWIRSFGGWRFACGASYRAAMAGLPSGAPLRSEYVPERKLSTWVCRSCLSYIGRHRDSTARAAVRDLKAAGGVMGIRTETVFACERCPCAVRVAHDLCGIVYPEGWISVTYDACVRAAETKLLCSRCTKDFEKFMAKPKPTKRK